METRTQIEKIGTSEATLGLKIALSIDAVLLLAALAEHNPGFSRTWIAMPFAISLVVLGRWCGAKTAIFISHHRGSWAWAGVLCMCVSLAASTMLAGFMYWISKSVRDGFQFGLEDLLMTTFAMPLGILMYSSFVIVPHGVWFGYRIATQIKKLQNDSTT